MSKIPQNNFANKAQMAWTAPWDDEPLLKSAAVQAVFVFTSLRLHPSWEEGGLREMIKVC